MSSSVPKNLVSRLSVGSLVAVPARLQERDEEGEPDGDRHEQEVVDRGGRELPSRAGPCSSAGLPSVGRAAPRIEASPTGSGLRAAVAEICDQGHILLAPQLGVGAACTGEHGVRATRDDACRHPRRGPRRPARGRASRWVMRTVAASPRRARSRRREGVGRRAASRCSVGSSSTSTSKRRGGPGRARRADAGRRESRAPPAPTSVSSPRGSPRTQPSRSTPRGRPGARRRSASRRPTRRFSAIVVSKRWPSWPARPTTVRTSSPSSRSIDVPSRLDRPALESRNRSEHRGHRRLARAARARRRRRAAPGRSVEVDATQRGLGGAGVRRPDPARRQHVGTVGQRRGLGRLGARGPARRGPAGRAPRPGGRARAPGWRRAARRRARRPRAGSGRRRRGTAGRAARRDAATPDDQAAPHGEPRQHGRQRRGRCPAVPAEPRRWRVSSASRRRTRARAGASMAPKATSSAAPSMRSTRAALSSPRAPAWRASRRRASAPVTQGTTVAASRGATSRTAAAAGRSHQTKRDRRRADERGDHERAGRPAAARSCSESTSWTRRASRSPRRRPAGPRERAARAAGRT